MSSTQGKHDSSATVRTVRSWLLVVTASLLAVCAHAAAGGGAGNLWHAMLLTALIGWIAHSLADRTRGPVATLATLGVAQLAMHGGLTVLDTHHHEAATSFHPLAMALTHAVATVITALLLHKAEHGLLLVLAKLRTVLPALVATVPPLPPTRVSAAVVAPAGGCAMLDVLLRRICTRRGPPALS